MPVYSRALTDGSPIVKATIGPSAEVERLLSERGESPRQAVLVDALIDTGAECSCIDAVVARQLSLQRVDYATVWSALPSDDPEQCDVFDAHVRIIGSDAEAALIEEPSQRLVAVPSLHLNNNVHMLVGRDLLQAATFMFSMPLNWFAIINGPEASLGPARSQNPRAG